MGYDIVENKYIWYNPKEKYYIKNVKTIHVALIHCQLDSFRDEFEEEIKEIRKAYNDKVKLKFGAIKYYS